MTPAARPTRKNERPGRIFFMTDVKKIGKIFLYSFPARLNCFPIWGAERGRRDLLYCDCLLDKVERSRNPPTARTQSASWPKAMWNPRRRREGVEIGFGLWCGRKRVFWWPFWPTPPTFHRRLNFHLWVSLFHGWWMSVHSLVRGCVWNSDSPPSPISKFTGFPPMKTWRRGTWWVGWLTVWLRGLGNLECAME